MKERIVVALKEPIQVVKWGYEVTRQDILEKMSNDVLSFNGKPEHSGIALGHPKFAHYREILPDVMMKLTASISDSLAGQIQEFDSTDEQRKADLEARLHYAVVETVVREEVGKHLVQGTERKLFTKAIDTNNKGRWKSPWTVTHKRVVKTGKYRPSSEYVSYEGEHEYDSGGLDDMKTHVLFKLYREHLDGFPSNGQLEIIVDKENTYEFAGERAAELLMRP